MLVIISFILMILRNDSVLLLKGEIRCWSLLGFKGLIKEFAVFLITYYLFIYLFIYLFFTLYVFMCRWWQIAHSAASMQSNNTSEQLRQCWWPLKASCECSMFFVLNVIHRCPDESCGHSSKVAIVIIKEMFTAGTYFHKSVERDIFDN